MSERFDSKRDWWLSAILWGTNIVLAWTAWQALTLPFPTWERLLALLVTIPTVVLVTWLWMSTYYEVTANDLIIQCGPISRVVPLAAIQSVRATRSPISSPALSLDRLRIDYGDHQWVMVSPQRQDAFRRAIGHADG
ncbi:MAG: PH domain-containing protein [Gammaproteobacteria bacterium]|nr:PH domain-containing protein [Gammaproteobacteria bacterium]